MNTPTKPVALIVGASRGLGLAMVAEYASRGWQVIATVRGEASTPLHDLAKHAHGLIEIERMEITDPKQITALRQRLSERHIDLLFVNAGVATRDTEVSALDVSDAEFIQVVTTNVLAPLRVLEAFESLVPNTGTLGVMSSGLGSVADNEHGSWSIYRSSKAALNQLMRSFAAARAGDPRAMLLICPGWVRTDMGGSDADLSIDESIPCVVDTITNATGTPGLRYLDYRGHTVHW